MRMTPGDQWVDDIRRRIQAALNESQRDVLREQFKTRGEHRLPDPPETQPDEFDFVAEFEHQFENASRTTVRARIGNPDPPPIEALSPDEVVAAVDALMDLLKTHLIAVEFLGDVDYGTVYRYLTEELLDSEIDDIRIRDMWVHFTYATDAYNAEMWVEECVRWFFIQDLEHVLTCRDDDGLWCDMAGVQVTVVTLQALWRRMLPVKNIAFEPLETAVEGDEGRVIGRITWRDGMTRTAEVVFDVRRSRYLHEAWSVERSSLTDKLWPIYG